MQEILDYLYGLTRFGIKPGLEVTRELLMTLGNPQNKFKSIHIAGTNGKGSTSAFTSSILQKAGYKAGLYTSPHLIRFNERIKVNGTDITDKRLVELVKVIKAKAEEKGLQPTFFEFTTALAFLHFAEENVDMAVIETGLGGRLDSTNVLNPELCIITNIDMDHASHLGNTKKKIAGEKAGIIKPLIPLVTAEEDENILKIFKNKTDAIHILRDEIKFVAVSEDLEGQEFSVSGRINDKFKISMLGDYQIKNACTALLAIEILKQTGFKITEEAIKEGLSSARWPARLQIFSKEPLLIIDGAHNAAGMEMTRDFIKKIDKRKVLVLGIAKDKEIKKMVSMIAPLFEEVIVTCGNFKPAEIRAIAEEARKHCGNVKEISDCREAVQEALSSAKKDELVLVTGSLYLAGDVLSVLEKSSKVGNKLGQARVEQVQQ